MITANSAPGVAHHVDTRCRAALVNETCPGCTGKCGGPDAALLLSSGAVQATKRPAWWRRALRALGVRA